MLTYQSFLYYFALDGALSWGLSPLLLLCCFEFSTRGQPKPRFVLNSQLAMLLGMNWEASKKCSPSLQAFTWGQRTCRCIFNGHWPMIRYYRIRMALGSRNVQLWAVGEPACAVIWYLPSLSFHKQKITPSMLCYQKFGKDWCIDGPIVLIPTLLTIPRGHSPLRPVQHELCPRPALLWVAWCSKPLQSATCKQAFP